jgi:hypothetical protein
MRTRATLIAALAACVLCGAAPSAGADGDPASDVLVTQATFVPRDAGASASVQQRLEAALAFAAAHGAPIRVALIATSSDLGSVTALWQRPAAYASYLAEELSLLYRGAVLVVMPGGFGFHAGAQWRTGAAAALATLRPAQRAGQLAPVALRAVRALAGADGHPLVVGGPAPQPISASSHDAGPWIAFVVGLWLIGLSWWASLRARPLRALSPREPR